MIVGFTGTRYGLTFEQERTLGLILNCATVALHGDCVGGDEAFHWLALERDRQIIVYPPTNPRLRAFCVGATATHSPADYIVRNRRIVVSSDILVACPREPQEPKPRRGQGTWSTVRFARREGIPYVIVWPDGNLG